ncbi:MAG TPA: NAD(P)/FAD-dependent oxidoreductase [Puia sp.]
MTDSFDVIIIGGSYAGLAAGMALGRALRRVLVIDSGEPCNRFTPYSHNFITQDGKAPGEIGALAREQVGRYGTVRLVEDWVSGAEGRFAGGGFLAGGLAGGGLVSGRGGFAVRTASGSVFGARKLVFATGIRDILPPIEGFDACWGISVLHCPYCHGYEMWNEQTGILSNGEEGFDLSRLISNWTSDLTLYTNGVPTLKDEQREKLGQKGISIVEKEVDSLEHCNGHLQHIIFKDGTKASVRALYSRRPFEQHCPVPAVLGCELTMEGYIQIDGSQMTTVPGVYACGDNSSRIRTVANAVATGTLTGMMINRELILEDF